jgi:hypothetical protein
MYYICYPFYPLLIDQAVIVSSDRADHGVLKAELKLPTAASAYAVPPFYQLVILARCQSVHRPHQRQVQGGHDQEGLFQKGSHRPLT